MFLVLVQRFARKRIDDQERSEWAFGLGAVTGIALVLTDDIGSGKQETESAATGTAARTLGKRFFVDPIKS